MKKRIGIPRSLLYYDYFPMWKTFFEEIDTKVVLSSNTTKSIMDDGIYCCVDEACIPIKLFHGHVLDLKDKADYIFIPRLKSVEIGTYICPKFCGLPDMVRFSLTNLPPLITTEICLRKSEKQLYKAFKEIGHVITDNNKKIKMAFNKACYIQDKYIKNVRNGILPINILENTKYNNKRYNMKVALIGQMYTIYDSFISMNIIKKLNDMGVEVITPELIEPESIIKYADLNLHKKMYWSVARRIIGSHLCMLDNYDIDGVIFMMSFACGIDAFVSELCESMTRRKSNIPFTLIMIDEHSGDAGFNTRIEAFVDMIKWRDNHESNFPAHG